ncbi:hypothetical protein L2E82_36165 [Cichorium intybus]|uniref:Uncharacterized protein n=1 Tax=Cichorium intybus TaxID=13427 RepID=A0ACB9BQT4_CICIN|nr:hypothetical protein L2E82_36165 [Cichorium intybus]
MLKAEVPLVADGEVVLDGDGAASGRRRGRGGVDEIFFLKSDYGSAQPLSARNAALHWDDASMAGGETGGWSGGRRRVGRSSIVFKKVEAVLGLQRMEATTRAKGE